MSFKEPGGREFKGRQEDEPLSDKLEEQLQAWAAATGLKEEDILPAEEAERRAALAAAPLRTAEAPEELSVSDTKVREVIREADMAERLAGYPDIMAVNPEDYPEDKELLEFAQKRQRIKEISIPKRGTIFDGDHREALRQLARLAGFDRLAQDRIMTGRGEDPIDFLLNRLQFSVRLYENRGKPRDLIYKAGLHEALLEKLLAFKENSTKK